MANLDLTHGVINVDTGGLLSSVTIDRSAPEKELASAERRAEFLRRRWQTTYPQHTIEIHRITLGRAGGWRFA
jgi:hypothetical protein